MKVFMFPGQGSQSLGMGRELFERFPNHVAQADEALGYSVRALCLDDREGKLNQTNYTQPALFVVSALASLARTEELGRPNYCVGHSLGEYTALFAAGAFDFASGLALVKARGALMSEINGGAMGAVIGLSDEVVQRIISDAGITDATVANYNSPEQLVVGGTKEALEKLRPLFEAAGCKLYVPLKVSGAFHTKLMAPAASRFEAFLKTIEIRPPTIPVIANVTGRPYDATSLRATLTRQITSPVRWKESIQHLLENGATDFHEVGPGVVLTNLLKKIRPGAGKVIPQPPPPLAPKPTSPDAIASTTPLPAPPSHLPSPTLPVKPAIPQSVATESSATAPQISAGALGHSAFRSVHGVKYAYVAGAMYKGIASAALVIAMGKAGLLSFFGTGGLSRDEMEAGIREIQTALGTARPYGMNLVCNLEFPEVEAESVRLFLQYDIRRLEAAAYIQPTSHVIHFRLSGARRDANGTTHLRHVMAKVSHPEVAESFMRPAPERLLRELVNDGRLTPAEAAIGATVPVADDICVESDSGGHTDRGVALTLFPGILRLRDKVALTCNYAERIRVGAAGGIGDPTAAAAAFLMGADFILTGSINQCTVEAGTSESVKEILQTIDTRDTTYAPAGDMFEIGSKVQVLRKGVLFPARANHLYELYTRHQSWEEIDATTRRNIETRYFGKSATDVWEETRAYYKRSRPEILSRAEADPKKKLSLLFRWYFVHSNRLALAGDLTKKVDYQVHCGSALGAFNRWMSGTPLESWRKRSAPDIGQLLMTATATLLNQRWLQWTACQELQ